MALVVAIAIFEGVKLVVLGTGLGWQHYFRFGGDAM
jgi:hypothetical protein